MPSRNVKLFLSLILYSLDSIHGWCGRRMGIQARSSCVFLNYHSLSASQQSRFASQLAALSRLAQPLPCLRPELALEDGGCHAAVTFDDAFRSFKDYALPALERAKMPAYLFVPSGYLGKKSAWVDYGGDNPVGEEVVSAAELLEMVHRGFVRVGSHTVNHRNLVELSEAEARFELRESKRTLESILRQEVHSVSFPYGSFGPRELDLAREEGYKFCFSVEPRRLVSVIPGGLLGRVSVQPFDSPLEFELKVLGAYRWLPWASAWKRRLGRILAPQPPTVKSPAHA